MNKTLEEGREVVYDLYDDVKEEVVEPLSPRVTNMMASATRVMGQVNAISDKVDEISKWIVLGTYDHLMTIFSGKKTVD